MTMIREAKSKVRHKITDVYMVAPPLGRAFIEKSSA